VGVGVAIKCDRHQSDFLLVMISTKLSKKYSNCYSILLPLNRNCNHFHRFYCDKTSKIFKVYCSFYYIAFVTPRYALEHNVTDFLILTTSPYSTKFFLKFSELFDPFMYYTEKYLRIFSEEDKDRR
jgi:hypothetical protein